VFETGDMQCDGAINIADLTWLVSYLFGGGTPPGEHPNCY
jgi:hypothetical protein